MRSGSSRSLLQGQLPSPTCRVRQQRGQEERVSFYTRTYPCGRTQTVILRSNDNDNKDKDEDEFRPEPKRKPRPYSTPSKPDREHVQHQKPRRREQRQAPGENFQPGDKVQVEVVSFGPLGATVLVVAHHSHDEGDLVSEDQPPLATGLILQKEISYFRQARGNIDVVRGEILPAYVERVKIVEKEDNNRNNRNNSKSKDDTDNKKVITKLDIGLREFGGRAKTESAVDLVLQELKKRSGELQLGDRSTPEEIAQVFPGMSKMTFKRAVSALYKQRKVQPGPHATTLGR